MSDLVCGFVYPPADGTQEREIMDRFADFLWVIGRSPRNEQGQYLVSQRVLQYVQGDDIAPLDPEVGRG